MKLFNEQQYRGAIILFSIALVLVMLAVVIELVKPPKLLPSVVQHELSLDSLPMSEFDPNKADYEQLRAAGVPKQVAVGIIRWRSYGKVYRVKEDLALVTGMTDSLYVVFEPYIEIADSLAAKPKHSAAKPKLEYQTKRYTSAKNSFRKEELPQRGYGKDTLETPSKKSAEVKLLELNSADSAALISVDGIGVKSAVEIIKYRELLGGYHSVEQISELKCVTEQNFAKILQQICCDSCEIQKIDINFAAPKEIARHPYVSSRVLRKIIKQRQLKGGWSRIEEMVEDEILSDDEAKRLAPYLWFRLNAAE
ncbi:MAG: helix-hairpin-helix domain-containing protein [Alistipes sp.]|nr:helix-hairpin-helix domain-containing protein [Alistipes sp.]